MKPTSWDAVRVAVGGEVIAGTPKGSLIGVSIDSRTVAPGQLFFALPGKRVDGHAFVAEAALRGAAGAVVSKAATVPEPPGDFVLLRVADTGRALADLARAYRLTLGATFIGVTGSNGKTTTKEMIGHILSQSRRCLWSPKSFNNQLGVPLTLLSAEPEHEFVVLEMGANHPGEIAELAALAKPHVGVLTNVSECHLEGFGSVEGIARAKRELVEAIPAEGLAILNRDNRWVSGFAGHCAGLVKTYAVYSDAHHRGSDIQTERNTVRFTVNHTHEFTLQLLGAWNVYNALAAIATTHSLGLEYGEIAQALASFRPPPMRMETSTVQGVQFINDAYNSNPRALRLALDAFEALPARGRKILALGEMRELGEQTDALHQQVGEQVAAMHVDAVVLVGPAMRHAEERLRRLRGRGVPMLRFDAVGDAAGYLAEFLREGDVIFLKGSRATRMEAILDQFRALGALVAGTAS